MKSIALLLAVLITGCASSSGSDGSSNVVVVTKLEKNCKFIRMQDCTNYRKNGDRRCYKTLKKQAFDAGADTVLVDNLINESEIIQLDNNAFGSKKTIVESSFYHCGVEQEI